MVSFAHVLSVGKENLSLNIPTPRIFRQPWWKESLPGGSGWGLLQHEVVKAFSIFPSFRSDVLTWLPASVLFVGVIYAGSKALSRLVSIENFYVWPGTRSPSVPAPFVFEFTASVGVRHQLECLTRPEN